VDVDDALAELLQLSSQVQAAVVLSVDGTVLGAAPSGSRRAKALAAVVPELVERAGEVRRQDAALARIEINLDSGGVFVVRDGNHVAAAATARSPVNELVIYDLRICLRRLEDGDA
jgi:predicted regulator of Ras-like GTPase activity (Roadblock/LC7/MglB family)